MCFFPITSAKYRVACATVAGLIPFIGHAAVRFSYLDNGGFEEPPVREVVEEGVSPTAWLHFAEPAEDTDSFGLMARHALSGRQCLFVNAQSGSNNYQAVIQRVPVLPGVKYVFSLHVRNNPDAPMPGNTYGQVSLEWKDASDRECADREWGPVWTPDSIAIDQWQRFSVTGVAPAGAIACLPAITLFSKGVQGNGGFLVDEATFGQLHEIFDDTAKEGEINSSASPSGVYAFNRSEPTPCAEHDNVNIPFIGAVTSFIIEATHPGYDVDTWDCAPDFTGCPTPPDRYSFHPAAFSLFEDRTMLFEAVRESKWRLPRGMTVYVENNAMITNIHYVRIYRKIGPSEMDWPQFLVLYMDGNLRLIPFPPRGHQSVCFGSSVLIGPAPVTRYPIAEILSVRFLSSPPALRVVYRDGSTALIGIESVGRELARVRVDAGYDVALYPFTTFRSMYVEDDNCDVERVGWLDYEGIYHGGVSIMDFNRGDGVEWFFHRSLPSRHNQSAPDIRIRIPEQTPAVSAALPLPPASVEHAPPVEP